MLNYLNGNDDVEEWDKLPEYLQNQITESIEQAEAGLGIPAREVIKNVKEKYGLND